MTNVHKFIIFLLLCTTVPFFGCSRCTPDRPPAAAPDAPRPVPDTAPPGPKQPLSIFDSHTHITPLAESVNSALRIFEAAGVAKFAVKSAGTPGEPRYIMTRRIAEVLGDKMAFFINLDWEDVDDPGWGKREADRLEQAMKDGASGVKIFKALGLGVRFKNEKLMRVDDKRMEPIWRRAGEVGAIVAWHVADPVAFFKPVDEKNERYGELSMAPEWSFHGKDYPSHEELLAQRDKVLRSFPKTIFLGIHLANHPEDLDYVDRLLDSCPNLFVDVAARLGEIGRHEAAKTRKFFIKHQDRILFGSDLIVTPRGMQLGSVSEEPPTFKDALKFYADHRRFFETADRNIPHPTPSQGPWTINAINLPRDVLGKLYQTNAEKLIFSKRRAWLKAEAARTTPKQPVSPAP